MLTNEQARAALAKLRDVEGWMTQRLAALAKLEPPVRDLGRILVGSNREGEAAPDSVSAWLALQASDTALLDRISDDVRRSLWKTLFPRLADTLDQAWRLQGRLPYQWGYQRKSFRAPRHPELTSASRFEWVKSVVDEIKGYDPDVEWIAAWAAHLDYYHQNKLGIVLAAAIDSGGETGDEVFRILVDSARGTHEIGAMGRHVSRALLAASRPEGWAFIEKMLLAAQREEGLRHSILQTINEAHPEAFRRMLRLIREHDLARFSSTVLAINEWFDFAWDSAAVKPVNAAIEQVLLFLDDEKARDQAIQSGPAESAYLALWTLGFEDAVAAIEAAAGLLADPDVERRFVAVHILAQVGASSARAHLARGIDDPDLRVAERARTAISAQLGVIKTPPPEGAFEALERLLERAPAKAKVLPAIVWPWQILTVVPDLISGDLPRFLGARPPTALIPHLERMDPGCRRRAARMLGAQRQWDAATRATLLELVGDKSPGVSKEAVNAFGRFHATPGEAKRLEGLLTHTAGNWGLALLERLEDLKDEEFLADVDRSPALAGAVSPPDGKDTANVTARLHLTPAEAEHLESLLTRKSGHLRLGVLGLLASQDDDAALASADRLLKAAKREPRLGGLELLRVLAQTDRRVADCHALARARRHQKIGSEEERVIDTILATGRKTPTLDDALGLLQGLTRSQPWQPQPRERVYATPTAIAILQSLDELIHVNRERIITITPWDTTQEELLGNVGYRFPHPIPHLDPAVDRDRLPLCELWETWLRDRPPQLRDDDGLEMLRAMILPRIDCAAAWVKDKSAPRFLEIVGSPPEQPLRYLSAVSAIAFWLVRLHPPPGGVDYLIDALETLCARMPMETLTPTRQQTETSGPFGGLLNQIRWYHSIEHESWTLDQEARFWGLLRWVDEPVPGVERARPTLQDVAQALRLGLATEADLIDHLLRPAPGFDRFHDLSDLTRKKPAKELERWHVLVPVIDRCKRRILEVELERGEHPTAASGPALAIQSLTGAQTLIQILVALGRDSFERGHFMRGVARSSVFGHLVRVCFPAESDTPESFADQAQNAGISQTRLVELAVYAPQWSGFVELALGWKMLAEAVWWLHAHTKDSAWSVDHQIRAVWGAEVAQRTALGAADLLDGAVDVAWFQRVRASLGSERWAAVDLAARYASSSAGHKRAQIFADAMLGNLKKADLIGRIDKSRHPDSLRALGLLPLGRGAARSKDLLNRYKFIQEFIRTSKQFGAQRQASEKRAAAIALVNLARTAGYPDPTRLEWAMEAQAVGDLAKGPVVVEAEGVAVTLALDADGHAELGVARGGKPLKSIPPAVKKDPRIAELLARRDDLKRQATRIRLSLEQAMCRGDGFSGAELRDLSAHPVLAPSLARLILIGEGIAGYSVEGGRGLRDHAGHIEPIKPDESLRIAHPHDLLGLGDWSRWQAECFRSKRIQPFKQVFRELYVLTETEQSDGTGTRRYAGQQVHPRQALALLGARGWVNHPEEGVRRTFHEAGLTASVEFLEGIFTPAEVEGLTIDRVHFVRRGDWKPAPLSEVPPRVFSEAMRDLDLVASVAHRGGVDPEASASTIESRSALLRETCSLLRLDNVRLNGPRAMVDGQLGNYAVHLGSAIVHRQPGGAICLVPVHAQHRGRLFLPFADDDPKTAEVISKVIMLARDAEIRDPAVLAQLRAAP